MLTSALDSWVNGATVIAGILAACVRPLRLIQRKRRGTYTGRCWQTPRVIMDCLTGATFVPFAVMAASAFLPAFIPLLTANKGALAIAGVVGGIAVTGGNTDRWSRRLTTKINDYHFVLVAALLSA